MGPTKNNKATGHGELSYPALASLVQNDSRVSNQQHVKSRRERHLADKTTVETHYHAYLLKILSV